MTCAAQTGWPPSDSSLDFLDLRYQQMEQPGKPAQDAQRLAPFAVKNMMKQFYGLVRRRVEQLEKELKE